MTETSFDAARYVVKLRGKDYLEVKWRLVWLRVEHPDAIISTELVFHDPERKLAIFKAEVAIPKGGSATGWGSETVEDFGDYLEKAETKALGRALAALGFGTQFTEDYEFGAAQGKVVDAPVQRVDRQTGEISVSGGSGYPRQQTNDSGRGDGHQRPWDDHPMNGQGSAERGPVLPLTEPQRRAIYSIGVGMHNWDEEQTDAYAREVFGKPPMELSRRQASELIDAMKEHRSGHD